MPPDPGGVAGPGRKGFGAAPVGARAGLRRVLMTADALGGVWQYALTLASGLRASGIEVVLAVLGPSPTPAQRAAAVPCAGAVVHAPGRLEWMDDPWEDVARTGEWLLDLERDVEPDVVHLNGYCHAALPWRAPALVVAHSCVWTWWRAVHGEDPPAGWARYGAEVARGLRAARLVVAPTAAMLHALCAAYGPVEGRVIPNGCAEPARRARRVRAKANVILAAGRAWDEAKNIEALCAVGPRLSWPVCVAGDIQAPDGRCAATGSVRYLGRLDGESMQTWYGRAAIYALPARYEPFGLSVLEAASAGCALVLGDIPSLRENWTGAARFVPPDNRRALAAALQELIEDPMLRKSSAARALSRARQLTGDRMLAGYLAAYGDLVESISV